MSLTHPPPSCRPFLFFFFYCAGPPRALPSFPTRRSSDLCSAPIWPTMLGSASRSGGPGSPADLDAEPSIDRKSTRLNSSHMSISYAVFCLKKKKTKQTHKKSQAQETLLSELTTTNAL